jgi:hypothetical protein
MKNVYDPRTGQTKRVRHNLATKCKTKAEFNEYFRRWKRPNNLIIRNVIFTDFSDELMESVKTDYRLSTVVLYSSTIREFLARLSLSQKAQ